MTIETVEVQTIKSIQVQTTKLTGAGVEVVPMADSRRTHWSLYLRDDKGEARWVKDFPISGDTSTSFTRALVEAAKMSMEHKVPIEQVF